MLPEQAWPDVGMGVGGMAPCRESCRTGLAGAAGGVSGAAGQA